MLIATCNVNGIDGRLSNLLTWLKEAAPDVDCLQELKVPDEKLPEAAIGPAMARSGRAKELERRGDPGAGRPARGNSARLAWRSRRRAQPLYRSSDRRHDRRMPSCRTAIPRRDRSSITSCAGSTDRRHMPRASARPARRSCSPATTPRARTASVQPCSTRRR
jgi:hypothetical protein